MKIKTKGLRRDIKEKCIDAFYRTIEFAEKQNKIKSLLSDMLTESEIVMMGRRMLIAKRLLGKQKYEQIARELGVGFDTVYKVKNWLGSRHQGLEKVIEKIKKTAKPGSIKRKRFADYYPTDGMAEIRRRYRNYYWLSDLLDEINDK